MPRGARLLPLTLAIALVPLVALLPRARSQGGEGMRGGMVAPSERVHAPNQDVLDALLAGASDQVRAGEHTYHVVCAACHGNSGLGLDEGRQMFPTTHQTCSRCHRPGNPPLWDATPITPRNSFAIGQPPALRGASTLPAGAAPPALFAYLRGAMPRYRPGMLTGDEYRALTAFLLALNGRLDPAATLAPADVGQTEGPAAATP